jgi:hypothetical protein
VPCEEDGSSSDSDSEIDGELSGKDVKDKESGPSSEEEEETEERRPRPVIKRAPVWILVDGRWPATPAVLSVAGCAAGHQESGAIHHLRGRREVMSSAK